MLIDARKLDTNTLIEGDICIIGAGAAGISIALEWINTPYKVLLLEGGGFDYENEIQDLYKGKTTGQRYFSLRATRIHCFGGTTKIWGGFCAQFDQLDFKKRDWVAHSGWPISKKDIDPYYHKATDILDLASYDYNVAHWQKEDPSRIALPIDENVVWNKMWQFSPPTRFGYKYKDTIVNAGNIHLYTYANVTNITANDNLSEVTEVTAKNHEGKTLKVRAKHYILASGAIQNARLLLASNTQNRYGLGNENDVVGRYFMEHIEVKGAEIWLSRKLPMQLYLLDYGKTKARAELAISEAAQEKFKILNGTAAFRPLDKARHTKPFIDIWNTDDPRKNKLSTWEKVKNRLLKYKDEATIDNIDRAYEFFTRIEQVPNPNSRVTLDTEKDALGIPRIQLHWELTPFDKRSIRKIYEIIGQQVGITDIARVKLFDYLQDKNDTSWPDFTSGGWHHMGTTRMSSNPQKGVVDANCKVHGINNLYISGSSCFTTGGAVNPTLTLVALSLRLAAHLKEKMNRH